MVGADPDTLIDSNRCHAIVAYLQGLVMPNDLVLVIQDLDVPVKQTSASR